MKTKMIITALLLMGNAQTFTAMQDIPSMRPAEIVKLEYARLSPTEQNSLWFTAMFAGLGGARKAARKVISSAFPAATWQHIEQIAQSAKQSNTIDDGIALARATVEPKTPVAPEAVKTPSRAQTPPVVTPIAFLAPEPVVLKPTVASAAQGQAPSAATEAQPVFVQQGQQETLAFTQDQEKEIQSILASIKNIDDATIQLLPTAAGHVDYQAIKKAITGMTFKAARHQLRQIKNGLQYNLNELKQLDRELTKRLLSIEQKGLFSEIQKRDPKYSLSVQGLAPAVMSNYSDFSQAIANSAKKEGVREALEFAIVAEQYLMQDLAKLKQEEANKR